MQLKFLLPVSKSGYLVYFGLFCPYFLLLYEFSPRWALLPRANFPVEGLLFSHGLQFAIVSCVREVCDIRDGIVQFMPRCCTRRCMQLNQRM